MGRWIGKSRELFSKGDEGFRTRMRNCRRTAPRRIPFARGRCFAAVILHVHTFTDAVTMSKLPCAQSSTAARRGQMVCWLQLDRGAWYGVIDPKFLAKGCQNLVIRPR